MTRALSMCLVVFSLSFGCTQEDVATIDEAQEFGLCEGEPEGGYMCSAACSSEAAWGTNGCLMSYAPDGWRQKPCPDGLGVTWRGLEGCCLPLEDGMRFYACVPGY